MNIIHRAAVSMAASLVIVGGSAGVALACAQPPPPTEVSVCWQIDNPDTTNSTPEFPQTFVAEGDANETAQTLCPTSVPKCSDDAEFQFDKYYLGEGDREYLDGLEANGLTKDPGANHANDDRLSPHDYSDIVLLSSRDNCTPPPPPPPPHHPKHKHAHVGVHVTDKCNCFMDKVRFHWNSKKVQVHVTHPNRTTWKAAASGKKVHGVQYLLPKRLNGHTGWAKVRYYTVHTTNVKCPCHITHTCPHNGPPHHHCPTDGKLEDAKPCH